MFSLDRDIQFEKTSSTFNGISFSCHGFCGYVQSSRQFTILFRCYLSSEHLFTFHTLVSTDYHVSSNDFRLIIARAIDLFRCSFNYELYFGFSWIFTFISIDRWIKVEWPSKSQTLCTRQRFLHLCLFTLIVSLVQNFIYTFLCLNEQCDQRNRICEISIHTIYIVGYMVVPIALILISISRTCLITLHVKKRFRPPKRSTSLPSNQSNLLVPTTSPVLVRTSRSTSSSFNSDPQHQRQHPNRSSNLAAPPRRRRRRSGLDTQMVILISINVAPFIFVHIINEIAYLFEKYSSTVAQSPVAKLLIILIYLSWYFISATRFYTNCLLSRIYREEFKNRIYALRYGCRPRIIIVERIPTHRHSSRPYVESMINGLESTMTPNM